MTSPKLHLVNKYSAENGLERTASYLSQFKPDEDVQRYQCTYDSLNEFLAQLTECTSSLYSYLDTKGKLAVDESTLKKIRDNQLVRSRSEAIKSQSSNSTPEVKSTVVSQPSQVEQADVLTIKHSDLNLIISDVFAAVVKQIPQLQIQPEKPKREKPKKSEKVAERKETANISNQPKGSETQSNHQIQANVSDIPVPFDNTSNEPQSKPEPKEKRRKFDGKRLWDKVDWYVKRDLPKSFTKDYKLIVHTMNMTVREKMDVNSPIYENVIELSNIMDEYFSVRFAYNRHDGHKYYPELYKEYLSAFAIGYSHALVKGELDSFRDEYNTWVEDVKAGKNKYSAPPSVGWVFRDLSNPKTATPDAYVDKNTLIVAQMLWGQIIKCANPLIIRDNLHITHMFSGWLPCYLLSDQYGSRMYMLLNRTLDGYDISDYSLKNKYYKSDIMSSDNKLKGQKLIERAAA